MTACNCWRDVASTLLNGGVRRHQHGKCGHDPGPIMAGMWVCSDWMWGRVCRPNCGPGPRVAVGVYYNLQGQRESLLTRRDMKLIIQNLLEMISKEMSEATNISRNSLKKLLEASLDRIQDKYSIPIEDILETLNKELEIILVKERSKRSADGIFMNEILHHENNVMGDVSRSYFDSSIRAAYKKKFYRQNVYLNSQIQSSNSSREPSPHGGHSSLQYSVSHTNVHGNDLPLIATNLLPLQSSSLFGNNYVCVTSSGQWYPSYLSVRPVCTSEYSLCVAYNICRF